MEVFPTLQPREELKSVLEFASIGPDYDESGSRFYAHLSGE